MLAIATTLSIVSGNCSDCISTPIEDATTAAVNAIDDALETLADASADWQAVLTNLVGELTDEAQSTIRNEVSNLLSRTVATGGAELRCNVDFLRDRVRQGLLRIKARLLGTDLPPLEPGLCGVVPLAIDMSLEPARRNVVEFYGYDFDTTPITVLHVTGGNSVDQSDKLTRPTHYHMTLNLGGNGIVLGPNSERLVLRWGGADISTIAVIQPQTPVCRTRTQVVRPDKLTVVGDHTRGDREFDGHGPNASTTINLIRSDARVDVRALFVATETQSDWTTARKLETRVAFNAPVGWRIESIHGQTTFSHGYRDTDHAQDDFEFPGGLVKRLVYVGDTSGDDVGETRVEITFNEFQVTLAETGDCVSPHAMQAIRDRGAISPATLERLRVQVQPLDGKAVLEGKAELRPE